MDILLDTKNLFLLITALFNLILAVLIFFYGIKYKINKVYVWNILAIISWILAMFLYRSAPLESSLFWCIILYITPTVIASSFLYFTYIFPSQTEKKLKIKKI